MKTWYDNADAMMAGMIKEILWLGEPSEARGRRTLDMQGWNGTLVNPRARRVNSPPRGIRPGYSAASVAWNLGLKSDVESICWWNPHGRKISDNGKYFHGANYGQRMMAYLTEAIGLIKDDPGTRRAWVPIWRPTDLVDRRFSELEGSKNFFYSREGKDVPCTIGFGLNVRKSEREHNTSYLDMNVVMRSQSAWGVFPYDIYLFTVIQELCANQLNVGMGRTDWYCGSAHIYEEEVDRVTEFMKGWDNGGQVLWPGDPMEAIPVNLEEALRVYPRIFKGIIEGDTPEHREDPVILEMIEGSRGRMVHAQ